MTLHGHTKGVTSVALSADGRMIVSGSCDKTLKVWDAVAGTCLMTLYGHTKAVMSVAVSADGLTIASGSRDETVKVWDAVSGACRQTLRGHTSFVESVALSADGLTIVSGSWDKTLIVWAALSGACRQTLRGHTSFVESVALSADGRTIVVGSGDKTLKYVNTDSGGGRATYGRYSAEAQAAWRSVGCFYESSRLSTVGGVLHFPLRLLPETPHANATTADSGGLFVPGSFDQAYGPLSEDTILAFTANGEAHWFRIRRRDDA